MNLKPDTVESNGYMLLNRLEHMELVPFVRTYINKRTRFSNLYMLSNLLIFATVGYLLVRHFQLGTFTISEGLVNLCYGFAIAFLLLPIHEYIHVLAYKSQGAEHTSYDANLRKFYFLAVADQFVASKREFQVVALAPFVVITSVGLVLLVFATPFWSMTVLGTLLTHTAFSYFDFHKNKEVVTYDDKVNRISFFYGK